MKPAPCLICTHGKYSSPQSRKIQLLTAIAYKAGMTTYAADHTTSLDPSWRVEQLKQQAQQIDAPVILVGSSMGGYVSTVVASEIKVEALFLLAPAFYLPYYKHQRFSPQTKHLEIIHGWNDDVVPVKNVMRFASRHKANLYLRNDGHRLEQSYDFIEDAFSSLLKKLVN